MVFVWLIYSYPSFYPVPQFTGKIVNFFLNAINITSIQYGRFLIVDFVDANRIFKLSAECAGIILYSVFLLVIFIVPQYSLLHRMIGLAFIPLLFIGITPIIATLRDCTSTAITNN